MIRRHAFAAVLLLLASGCTTGSTLDLGRAGRALRGHPPPPAPVLVESPASELPAATGIRATRDELREVAVSWDPVLSGQVGGYVVERSLAENGPFSRVATLTDRFETGLVDRGFDLAPKSPNAGGEAGLGDGSEYFYRVAAYDDAGRISGLRSGVAAGRTAPRPAPPEGLQVLSRLPRKVALVWRPSDDATVKGYVVLRSPGAAGPFESVAEVEGRHRTHYVDRGLGDLHVFYYQVMAVNRAGARGAGSEPALALTKPDPLPPSGLRIVAQDGAQTVLSWSPNVEPDVVAYRVLRRSGGSDEAELVAVVNVPETSVRDEGAHGADDAYLVIAIDADGLESEPAEISVGGAASGPPLSSADAVGVPEAACCDPVASP